MPLTREQRLKISPLPVQHTDHQGTARIPPAVMGRRPFLAQHVKDMVPHGGPVFGACKTALPRPTGQRLFGGQPPGDRIQNFYRSRYARARGHGIFLR